MKNTLNELLEIYNKAHELEVADEEWDKLHVPEDAKGGLEVHVYWKHRDEDSDPDCGYLFCLDGMNEEEFDFFVHVNNMLGDDSEAWVHLYDLITNEQIDYILVKEE